MNPVYPESGGKLDVQLDLIKSFLRDKNIETRSSFSSDGDLDANGQPDSLPRPHADGEVEISGYAGQGTFAAEVACCMAPESKVHVVSDFDKQARSPNTRSSNGWTRD
jgi:hypothetical protein